VTSQLSDVPRDWMLWITYYGFAVTSAACPFLFPSMVPQEVILMLRQSFALRLCGGLLWPDVRITCSAELVCFFLHLSTTGHWGISEIFPLSWLLVCCLAISASFCALQICHYRLCSANFGAINDSKALQCLLNDLCDAVLVLKHDLTLAEPSQKFAALLLQTEAPYSWPGRSILDFIVAEDRDCFNAFIAERGVLHQQVYSASHRMQVRFRTVTAAPVLCEVHHVLAQTRDGAVHFLGVNEVGDHRMSIDTSVGSGIRLGAIHESEAHRLPLGQQHVETAAQQVTALASGAVEPHATTFGHDYQDDQRPNHEGDVPCVSLRWGECTFKCYRRRALQLEQNMLQFNFFARKVTEWGSMRVFLKDLHNEVLEVMRSLDLDSWRRGYVLKFNVAFTTATIVKESMLLPVQLPDEPSIPSLTVELMRRNTLRSLRQQARHQSTSSSSEVLTRLGLISL